MTKKRNVEMKFHFDIGEKVRVINPDDINFGKVGKIVKISFYTIVTINKKGKKRIADIYETMPKTIEYHVQFSAKGKIQEYCHRHLQPLNKPVPIRPPECIVEDGVTKRRTEYGYVTREMYGACRALDSGF